MATPKKPLGIYSKGRGVSNINPDAKGSDKEKYADAVQTLRETAETKKDVGNTPGQMAAAGRKYKQDSTKDVNNFKKLVREVTPQDVPPSWKANEQIRSASRAVKKMENGVLTRRHPNNKAPKGN